MSEPLTPERRADLRRLWLAPPGDHYSVCIPARELTALLDAADERDRLAAVIARVAYACQEDADFWEHSDGWVAAQRAILAILRETDHA